MIMRNRIVIISPSPALASSLEQLLSESGCSPETVPQYPTAGELEDRLSVEQPTAGVLIDYASESQAMNVLRKLHRSHPELPLVIINGPRKLSSVVQTKSAGAWGYIPESHSSADIRSLAAQLSDEKPAEGEEPGTGTLVSFIPAKGGSGASTIALHVGAAVSEQDVGRSLLVDFDFHTGTPAFQLGLQPEKTLLSTLTAGEMTAEALRQAIVNKGTLNLLAGASDVEEVVPETFRHVPQLLTLLRQMYRYVFVDLPTATFSSSMDVLAQSDSVYLVCTPEITSLYLAKRKILRLRSRGIPLDNVRAPRATRRGVLRCLRQAQPRGMEQLLPFPQPVGARQHAGLLGRKSIDSTLSHSDIKNTKIMLSG